MITSYLMSKNEKNKYRENFIHKIIKSDLKQENYPKLITRFPPEPNGYLHIGHAKSIFLNFGLISEHGKGHCNLRFDDTNPSSEKKKFIEAIKEDLKWLGVNWEQNVSYTSDYFEELYKLALKLIRNGDAYVCDLSTDEMRDYRGTLKNPGKDSPYRNRDVEENIKKFKQMREGVFPEGSCTLRAKIDMSSGNINMRDPSIYRIKKMIHSHTGTSWCIYPMYDFAHAASDAIEKVTHSLCTLEFQDHRPLYDWIIEKCDFSNRPKQIEFSRLDLSHTVTSKRKLKLLIENGLISDWDDPRMPTIQGLRRRGIPASAIRRLMDLVGVSKQESVTEYSLFEEVIRDDLDKISVRRNAVLRPILVEIDGLQHQVISVPNHPKNLHFGRREITISNQIYIERDDFIENFKEGYKKLYINGRIRLLHAYVIECYKIEKDSLGSIVKLKCTYLPETFKGGKPNDGFNASGVLHWVDANNCISAEIRQYNRLFHCRKPGKLKELSKAVNPNSLVIINNAKLEVSLKKSKTGENFQFNRVGYFCREKSNCSGGELVFNQTINLKNKLL